MVLSDVVNQLVARAQTLGLLDRETGYVDRSELAEYVQQALRYLANRYQLQLFMESNRHLFQTVAGVETYQLPANYGFWAPTDERHSGLAIASSTGTDVVNLQYYDPARFALLSTTTSTGMPFAFTLTQDGLSFFPIPDAVYTIWALQRTSQEGATAVPDQYVEAVKVETLYRMAADRGRLQTPLVDERHELLRTLVNNESRFRQRFTRNSGHRRSRVY